MEYSFKQVRKGIILVKADSQYSLCSMFLRPQEFYESPYKNIRGRHFTLEEYMDTYVKYNGSFSYYTDWCGFNIPSKSFKKFVELFQYDMSAKENLLVSSIRNLIPNLEGNFYIIGTCKKKDAFNHEIAHAFWYLDQNYRDKMHSLISQLPKQLYEQDINSLLSMGYDYNFAEDELQAYLAASSNKEIKSIFGKKDPSYLKISKKIKKFFKEYFLTYPQ